MNNRQLMHVIQKALFKLFFFRRFQSKEQQRTTSAFQYDNKNVLTFLTATFEVFFAQFIVNVLYKLMLKDT